MSKNKLNFQFIDEQLYVQIPNGYVLLEHPEDEWVVRAFDGIQDFKIGSFDNIYDALDAANTWYSSEHICGDCGSCGETGCCPPETCKYFHNYKYSLEEHEEILRENAELRSEINRLKNFDHQDE